MSSTKLRQQGVPVLKFFPKDFETTTQEIATLVHVPVERPPDRSTDFEGGAQAAEELGMARFAERLRTLGAAR